MRSRPGLAVAACALAVLTACQPPPPPYDLIVRGGSVLDGTGAVPVVADVAVRGDRIVAIGDLADRAAGQVIDARGLVVAPGFIDVQGQSGTTLLADGTGESHLRQGITTEVIGEGNSPAFWTADAAETGLLDAFGIPFDWTGFDGYFHALAARGVAINVGTLVPATQVRRQVVGLENRPPTADELQRMEALVDRAMLDGALGLSSALIYPPGSYAATPELVALAKVSARHGGIYVSHVRGESFNLFNALDEAIAIGREADLPVVVFHLKVGARENWGRMPEVIARLNAAMQSGVRIGATMYPYTAGGTSLAASLPLWVQEGGTERMLERLADPAVRARAREELETRTEGWENLLRAATFEGIQIASVPDDYDQSVIGRRITEIAEARGTDPWDVYFDVIRGSRGRAGALYHMMSEEDVRTALQWGNTSIGTDSAAIRTEGRLAQGSPHPRAYGTFPRVLGKYVREEHVIELREAVRRMTSLAAAQFHVDGRGILREGLFADLVVFDADTIRDRATYDAPHQYPVGVRWVIVNGVPVLTPDGVTGSRPGRAVYGPGRAR